MHDIVRYWLLLVLRAILSCVDKILDTVFGISVTKGSKEERLIARNYDHSAHVVKILWKAKPTLLAMTKEHHFIYKHEQYVHPNYILQNANVTIMAIQKNFAVFAETDPQLDIYDSKRYPFTSVAQFSKVERHVFIRA